jgi:hypothetical protein
MAEQTAPRLVIAMLCLTEGMAEYIVILPAAPHSAALLHQAASFPWPSLAQNDDGWLHSALWQQLPEQG